MKNAILLVIDALRYDVLADAAARRAVAPNLARLAERGFVRPAIANGQTTQFVLPSIFSQSYPLDYGGYNNGIRGRPRSFVEQLQEHGYATHLMAACLQVGVGDTGYERGFDTNRNVFDFRTMVEQRISRTLSYELELWQRGQRSEAETVAIVRRELDLLLAGIESRVGGHDKSIWPRRLHRANAALARGCAAERALLRHDPLLVLNKLAKVPAGVYRRFLGARRVDPAKLFLYRAMASIAWRSRKWFHVPTAPNIHIRSEFQATAGELIGPVGRFVATTGERPWFVYIHVMDAHDCNFISRPLHFLGRLRYLPRWARNRATGKTKRKLTYDSAVAYVDRQVGRLLRTLEDAGRMRDTVILVTGDHGLHYAESPRPRPELGDRGHYEDIDVPLLVANSGREPSDDGLLDSMSVSATLLDALGVPPHESFKGRSAFAAGRAAVVTENAGRGNADIKRRDLHFTVTTASHKLMAVLRGDHLQPEKLFDRAADPKELDNIIDRPEAAPAVARLLDHLWSERGEILASRGAGRDANRDGVRLAS